MFVALGSPGRHARSGELQGSEKSRGARRDAHAGTARLFPL